MPAPTTPTDNFGLFVDQLRDQAAFMQGFNAAMDFMRTAAAEPVYQPSDKSIAAARRSMGAQGLAPLLTSRIKLNAAEKARVQAKANAAKLGFRNGQLVG